MRDRVLVSYVGKCFASGFYGCSSVRAVSASLSGLCLITCPLRHLVFLPSVSLEIKNLHRISPRRLSIFKFP